MTFTHLLQGLIIPASKYSTDVVNRRLADIFYIQDPPASTFEQACVLSAFCSCLVSLRDEDIFNPTDQC